MATNLFAKAKKSAPAKTTKAKDQKVRIAIEDASFFDKVSKLEQLNDTMKSAKAKADMISDELRDLGKSEWAQLYEQTGKNPGSVMLEHVSNDDTAQFMFVPTDKYITITAERAEELQETYGDEIVEEKTVFSFFFFLLSISVFFLFCCFKRLDSEGDRPLAEPHHMAAIGRVREL